MWGTLEVSQEHKDLTRFIPTHVGNAGPVIISCALTPVHPHACGERTSSNSLNLYSFFKEPFPTDKINVFPTDKINVFFMDPS